VQGPAMSPSCSGCVDAICAQDPYCCSTDWDDVCVSHVDSICSPGC
jgi:hypothetical protein